MISSSPYQVQSSDISRKSSVKSNNTTPRKKSGLDNVVVCKDIPTKHTHIGSPIDTHELPSATIEWMKEIELQYPAILYSSQESSMGKSQQADLWAAKQYKISPNAKLLVRVFDSKLYLRDDKHYQLVIKAGKISAKSCLSSKVGTIEDWFLLDLENTGDLSSAAIEVIMETIPDQQYKQHKQSAVLQKATEFFSGFGRSGSLRRDSFTSSNLPQTGLVRIPLAMLINNNLGGKPVFEIGGKFTVKGFNNQKMGEVTLHVVPVPNSIGLSDECRSHRQDEDIILHQSYITYEVKGEWKRYWALLTRDKLLLRDMKNRRNDSTSAEISLSDIVKLDMVAGQGQLNSIGLENCLELCFEDNTQIFMFADDDLEVRNWADAFSQAAWGQPFSSC